MTTIDDYVTALDEPHRATATLLHETIGRALPGLDARIYHSHPVWLDGKQPVAGFKAYPRYVTFMIWNAAPIEDAAGVLSPGARMWTARFASSDELDPQAVARWLAEARAGAESGS